jgi:hypothetical protein
MTAPVATARLPIVVAVEAGNVFVLRAFVRSANASYCNGIH